MPTDSQGELETTMTYNAAVDQAFVWSTDPTFQRKMQKLGVEPYKRGKRPSGPDSCWYRVPKTWIRVKPPVVQQLTADQRQQRVERGRTLATRKHPLKPVNSSVPPA